MSELADAWQRALGAEQQAVFGYALAGPHLPADTGSSLARTCQSAHEALRDAARAAISAAGGSPTPPPVDYPSLYPVRDARSAHLLAIRLETTCASAWRYLYAAAAEVTAPASAARAGAQAALTASAVRATQWRLRVDPAAATVAFPGI
ncbi:MAG: DUF4439 domain-containing protein [Jatrophihabitantaceae bacterium]